MATAATLISCGVLRRPPARRRQWCSLSLPALDRMSRRRCQPPEWHGPPDAADRAHRFNANGAPRAQGQLVEAGHLLRLWRSSWRSWRRSLRPSVPAMESRGWWTCSRSWWSASRYD